jgi:hypothetical protein
LIIPWISNDPRGLDQGVQPAKLPRSLPNGLSNIIRVGEITLPERAAAELF